MKQRTTFSLLLDSFHEGSTFGLFKNSKARTNNESVTGVLMPSQLAQVLNSIVRSIIRPLPPTMFSTSGFNVIFQSPIFSRVLIGKRATCDVLSFVRNGWRWSSEPFINSSHSNNNTDSWHNCWKHEEPEHESEKRKYWTENETTPQGSNLAHRHSGKNGIEYCAARWTNGGAKKI